MRANAMGARARVRGIRSGDGLTDGHTGVKVLRLFADDF